MSNLLDIPAAADRLGVPEGWLRKAVTARRVPFTRIGKHVRFTEEHLESIVRAGEQAPQLPQGRRRRSRL